MQIKVGDKLFVLDTPDNRRKLENVFIGVKGFFKRDNPVTVDCVFEESETKYWFQSECGWNLPKGIEVEKVS